MNIAGQVHVNEQIKSEYLARMRQKYGDKYMKFFFRPAYMYTTLEQKDIHEIREGDNDRN